MNSIIQILYVMYEYSNRLPY